ncbi:MAG: hypothetical protein U1F58_09070 [Burkholderiales bacterium]
MTDLPFTRNELLAELKELVFAFARSASFITNPVAGYRVLSNLEPAEPTRILEPESNSTDGTVDFSIDHMYVARTFNQFYDYGICGVRDFDLALLTGATEWSFAYAFALDVSTSLLIQESRNGEGVKATTCLAAARASVARCVLDGGERFFYPHGTEIPDGVLTLAEVALLAGLDERTVRNATNKSAPNRLGTTFINSSLYVPREAALTWLPTKRGFRPTRTGVGQLENAALETGFVGLSDAGQFVARRRRQLELSADTLASRVSGLTSALIHQLEEGTKLPPVELLEPLGEALSLPSKRFALRLREADTKDLLRRIQGDLIAAAGTD